ncbi:MAG: exosortase/archaeosortase family protein [Verrucomicrobiota bacterium]
MPSKPSPVPAPEGRTPAFALGLLPVCALILLWGYAIYRLGILWHSNDDYAFGWFVPLLCLCLFWERWKRRPARSPVRPGGGTFFMLGIFGLVLLPAALFLEIIPNWRFAGWIFAGAAIGITFIILYFLGGRSWSRYFAFPVIFFLIAVPWPTRLEHPLIEKMSKLNAAVSAVSSNVLGSPAVRHGVLIETGSGFVGVDEACSGIRSFQASVMVALFLGELFSFSILRRGILLFGAVALAFACNVVRTTYLVRIADLHGLAGVNLHHDQAGMTILGITLAGLLALVWLLRHRPGGDGGDASRVESKLDYIEELHNLAPAPGAEDKAPSPAPHNFASQMEDQSIPEPASATGLVNPFLIKAALASLVVWIILTETGINFWFRPAEKQAATRAVWSLKLPARAAEYRELPVSETVRAMLSYDEGHQAEWRDNRGCAWQLFYFRWLPAETRYRAAVACNQARGHAPDVCLKMSGMILQTNFGTQTISMNGISLRVGAERFLNQGHTLNIFSCYWEPNEWASQAAPGTIMAVRTVLHALKIRDRGWNEKRVIKLGVWGIESDEAAQSAFREYLLAMISK